jgi:hypothetical protein
VSIPLAHYLTPTDVFGLLLVVAALAFISATLLAQAFEFAERFWSGGPANHAPAPNRLPWRRPSSAFTWPAPTNRPEMVIESVESLLAIDWPAFEVIVVDNNTSDPDAREAGGLDGCPAGFAAALRPMGAAARLQGRCPEPGAGAHRSGGAVDRGGGCRLRGRSAVVPSGANHFHDPAVGLVQAPQAHRHWSARRFGG